MRPEDFWKRILKPVGCWLFDGGKDTSGYGYVGNPFSDTPKQIGTHRLAWILTHGPIPDGMQVLHKCDIPSCVNPDHLFLGTVADNTLDKVNKRRHSRGESTRSAKLTEAQAREILSLKGKERARILAQKFGVKPTAINAIWSGRLWKHIQEPRP